MQKLDAQPTAVVFQLSDALDRWVPTAKLAISPL
jgi:hypothetical protein